jgi:thioredoxin 1
VQASADNQINGDEPVVVDFWATWCGPCKMISPHFAKMEEKYPGVKLVKVDVEEQEVSPFVFSTLDWS